MGSHKNNGYKLPKSKVQGPSYRGISGTGLRTAEGKPNWKNPVNKGLVGAAAAIGIGEALLIKGVFVGGGPKIGGGGGSNGLPSSNKVR
jgi:hypothetical protein